MKRKYVMGWDGSGAEELLRGLEEYKDWLNRKCQELVDRLAEKGMKAAQWSFDMAYYVGDKDVRVTTERRGETTVAVVAAGRATLFLEFGAGVLMGYGHPEPQGFGPGTYPGKGHWDDPNGWFLPKDVQETAGQVKSYGNPPAMAMYGAVRTLEQDLAQTVREVFGNGG